MSHLHVVAPGFLTTVQDLGRPGYAASGVSASGAADALALQIGNRLVGNGANAAAVELTMVGGTFRFDADGVFALAGSDPSARLGERSVTPWRTHRVRGGETLVCGALRDGARSYLCVRGGLDVPPVFGSASTHLLTGLGGFEGRALRVGDRLPVGDRVERAPLERTVDPSRIPGYRRDEPLRATEGPQASWFAPESLASLFDTPWSVSEACDRMGIRLSGRQVPLSQPRELATEGVYSGAIQVPPGGAPIVLFVEHQTTGGYPKIASVIAADLARLGQLRPRDTIRFEAVSLAAARELLRAQREAVDALFS